MDRRPSQVSWLVFIHGVLSYRFVDDGATILKLLDIVHPAARTLVDIARAQDAEVGDGTTSVVLL